MPYAPPIHRPYKQGKAPRHLVVNNRQQTRAMHTGSKGWRLLRNKVLCRDSFTCADCGRFGDEVDHEDGNSHNNDPANLKTRCKVCHSRKTRREMAKATRA